MQLFIYFCFIIFGLFVRPRFASSLEEDEFYANLYSVELAQNHQLAPDKLASMYGYENLGEIIEGSNIYQFKNPKGIKNFLLIIICWINLSISD